MKDSQDAKARFVYTATDSNYFTQAAVLVSSLNRTQSLPTKLLILGTGWTDNLIEKITALGSQILTVEVQNIDSSLFEDVRLSHGFPLATAYNIIAPKYLLADYAKAIYMDADIVILDDLGPIWDHELKTPVAAVIDAHVGFIGFPSMWRPWRDEGVNPAAPYLNTGMMAIDLNAWREQQITEKCLELLARYELPCVDQDALNLVLNGNFDHMHPRFNQMPYHLMPRLRTAEILESPSELDDAITNPAMIHFHRSFLGKPWVRGCTHPSRKVWTNLADQVNPGWKKSSDWTNFAKSKAASLAKMTWLDSKVT